MTPEELLTTTRAVRKRLDLSRPVPSELIEKALTIALQAPSGSNREHWHWVVVTDPDQRAAIGSLYRRATHEYMASSGFAGKLYADDPSRAAVQHRVGSSVSYLADRMGEVPVLLIPCLETSSAELPAGNQAGMWASLLPAVWNYMLAARSLGLGTAWTTLHLAYEEEAAEVLGLPENVHQAALIPTAYYTGETFKPAVRQPLASVLHVDRW
ncbi:nitroreductase family protein [Amycolatopsis rhabdoformis]|uniref:Nitroreductase family protein n=1 Tax=Amycolatopsis rhabdoformis TaxID=1448059 RepID=A0ABZ1I3A1_9PSEU|nr:nitroreductase family protein [Amycolatopsis rhabdoformis]WSE28730.1 nitroreductase family protein [Amycolatopsis rhabdoformis]